MSSSSAAPTRTLAPVLADVVPGARVRDAALVLGGVATIAVVGQIAVPLPFTPVPLSLGTFAVLLVGAALGPARAAASVGLFLAAGMLGAPLFAEQGSGWAFASFGYAVGYLPAAILVGWLARKRADRGVLSTIGLVLVGSAVIYAFGLPWLMGYLGVGLAQGLALGVVPFLIGDAVKAAAAALVLPATWRLIGERR